MFRSEFGEVLEGSQSCRAIKSQSRGKMTRFNFQAFTNIFQRKDTPPPSKVESKFEDDDVVIVKV